MSDNIDKTQQIISQIAESFIEFKSDDQNQLTSADQTQNIGFFPMNMMRELRPFKCNFSDCNKDYSNKSRLEIHLRTHVNINL